MRAKRTTSIAALMLAAALPANAAQETQTSPAVTKKLNVRVGVGLDYETNAASLGDESIDTFDSGDFADDRFLINSIEDAIFAPSLQLTWSRTPANRRVTRAYVSFSAARHVNNGIRDFELIRFSFDQYLTDASEDLTQLARERREYSIAESTADERRELSVTAVRARRGFLFTNTTKIRARAYHTTNRYLGQSFNRDFGDRRANTVVGDTALVTWEQRLNRGDENRFRLDLTYRRTWSDYAVDFDERDATRDGYTVGVNYFRHTLPSAAYWQLGAAYERAIRTSNTDLIGTRGPAGVVVENYSRDDNTFYFVAARFWYRMHGTRALGRSNSLRFRARYGLSDYAADDPADRGHYLRTDSRYRFDVDYRHPVRNWAVVRAGAGYETRQARFDAAAGRDDPSPFNNLGVALGVILYLDLWRTPGR